MAPRLLGPPFEAALQFALTIGNELDRATALAALTPHLPKAHKVAVLETLLQAALTIDSGDSRAKVLVALAPHLPDTLLGTALDAARAIGDKRERAWVLARLSQLAAFLIDFSVLMPREVA